MIGFYEQDCDPWAVDGTPWDFGHELLPDNLDRIGDSLEAAFKRYPVLASAGIKAGHQRPLHLRARRQPAGRAGAGPANYWSACAVMAGFSQGGGVGLTLAEWMVEGEPSRDVFAMDVARFGDYCTPSYTRPRCAKTTSAASRLLSQRGTAGRAPAGYHAGLRPLEGAERRVRRRLRHGARQLFRAGGEEPYETPTFRRSNAFAAVAEECRAVREAVGINEIHNFGKYEVSGPGANAWLDRIMAGRMPRVGRMALNPDAEPQGQADRRFHRSPGGAEDEFQVTASFAAQAYHMRWFEQPSAGRTALTLRNISKLRIGFQIAGPKARELLRAGDPRRCLERGRAVPVGAPDRRRPVPARSCSASPIPATAATRSTCPGTTRLRSTTC